MLTRRRRPPLYHRNQYIGPRRETLTALDLHNRQDLEEVVLGEVLVRVVFMQLRPQN